MSGSAGVTAGERLEAAREALGLTRRGFADLVAEDEATIRRMESGEAEVWPTILGWAERQAARRVADPPSVEGVGKAEADRGLSPEEVEDRRARLVRGLEAMRWTARQLGRALNRTPQAMSLWTTGGSPVRAAALAWVERQVAAFEADPPPRRRTLRSGKPRGVRPEDYDAADLVLGRESAVLRSAGRGDLADRLDRVAGLLRSLAAGEFRTNAKSEGEGAAAPAAPVRASALPPPAVPVLRPMTEGEFRSALVQIGWNEDQLSAALMWPGLDPRNVRRMFSGRIDVPPSLAEWLRALVRLKPRPREFAELAGRPPEVPPKERWTWTKEARTAKAEALAAAMARGEREVPVGQPPPAVRVPARSRLLTQLKEAERQLEEIGDAEDLTGDADRWREQRAEALALLQEHYPLDEEGDGPSPLSSERLSEIL